MKALLKFSSFGLLMVTGIPLHAAVVAEWNFNTDGDTEGWTVTLASGPTASGGLLTGVANTSGGNDMQLNRTGLTIDLSSGQEWDELIFRVRETASINGNPVTTFNDLGLFLRFNDAVTIANPTTAVLDGDDFFTVTYDISGFNDAATISSIRLDPIGGPDAASNTFEIDDIQITSIPEPSAALLLGLTGALMLVRRR